jgi:hypothetical protein
MFTSFGLGAALVQGVHAHSKLPAHVMPEIELAGPRVYATFVLPVWSARIDGPNIVAKDPVSLFRVIVVVRGISSDWDETFVVNPEYPSFELCEAARGDLVEDFLQILKRRYLQPFKIDSRCVGSDGDV